MDIITLVNELVTGLLAVEDKFIDNLQDFPTMEKDVSELTSRTAAEFLSMALTNADQMIYENGYRKDHYTVIRKRQRTLISSVGGISFTHTLYKDEDGKTRTLLDEALNLPDRERFTSTAEAKIINEAEVHSYQHAADSLNINGQTIAKTSVMNKIHDIEEELPDFTKHPEEKKQCEYLYIEADEDHIHRQKENKENGCYIGKLIYVFEGKKELCEGRKELVAPFYFAGIYAGSDANAVLWESVEKYITDHYDQDYLKQVYINSDGGTWIKSAADHIYKGCMVADRFHLMKYINHVARCTLDSADTTKQDFYKNIYKDDLDEIEKLLTKIKDGCDNSDQAVDKCRTYLENNWAAIQKAFHDKNVLGCSAESHVSNVLSERMSSRPMAWSEIGTDRMCKLRCFIRNYGSDKVIDLVKYRREKEMDIPAATGTEGITIDPVQHKKYTTEQLKEYEYAKRLHGTLGENTTVHKILAIRNQLGNI